MRSGFWIQRDTGAWHRVDDHADWIRRPACARAAGLGEEGALRLAAMPRRRADGPERHAILLDAMAQGLIRCRGHGAVVTFEATLPLGETLRAAAPFMAAHLGPFTVVKINQLPDGPCGAWTYQEVEMVLAGGGPP